MLGFRQDALRGAALAAAILVVGGSAAAQELAGYERQAQEVILDLRGRMMQHLQTQLKAQGPAEATKVCRHLAPRIETELEAKSGWQVRRTALRVRNPDNAPNEQERGVLRSFLTRSMGGQSVENMDSIQLVEREGDRYVHYMKAIPTFEPCLSCHGEQLAPGVKQAIEKHYPHDQATGYAAGDLRGAFSLYKPYDPEGATELARAEVPDRAAPELPEELALTGDKRGNPRDGRDLFARHCASCHNAESLVDRTFGAEDAPEADLCSFLETHGLTDAARDCDIIAYMKALSRQQPDR